MMTQLMGNRYLRLLLVLVGVVAVGLYSLTQRFVQPLAVHATPEMKVKRVEVPKLSVGKRSTFSGEVRAQSSNALAAKHMIEVQTAAVSDFAQQRGGNVRLGDVYYHRASIDGESRGHTSVIIVQQLEIEVAEDPHPHRVETHLAQLGMTGVAHRVSTVDGLARHLAARAAESK